MHLCKKVFFILSSLILFNPLQVSADDHEAMLTAGELLSGCEENSSHPIWNLGVLRISVTPHTHQQGETPYACTQGREW